jgi:O-methyltransferase domain/Dimerisation domain
MTTEPKLPPARIARVVDSVRRRLRRIDQKLVPAPIAVLDMMTGAFFARAIYTAAKLGVADVLNDGPLTAEAIADRIDANPDAVGRMLRTLASRGIFAQQADGRFALTPLADVLRSDAPTSVRGLVLFWGDERHWEHWGQLPYAVRTGQPTVEALRGKPMFEFLDDDPEFAAIFNDGMTSASDMEIPTVLAAYDFTGMGAIVDVGGGHGRLLAAILRKWPRAHGILFDSETVVEGAPAVLDAAGVSDRCSVVGGSFFESVPSGGDAYVRKHIVHDWDESNVLQILRNVRAAMSSNAKLLVIESVVPDDDREHLSKTLDLEMLVVATGRERTANEYAELLRTAEFRFTRVIPTVGPTSIVEAEAA